jgi:hypothetical protein
MCRWKAGDHKNVKTAFVGRWLGTRQIRCNWATKGATSGEDGQTSDSKSIPDLTSNLSGIFVHCYDVSQTIS